MKELVILTCAGAALALATSYFPTPSTTQPEIGSILRSGQLADGVRRPERRPEDVVADYCLSARYSDSSRIKNLVTTVPKSFEDQLRRQNPPDEKERKLIERIRRSDPQARIGGQQIIDREYWLGFLTSDFPNYIMKLDYQITRLGVVAEKENDAWIQVFLGSASRNVAVDEEYFYLHRENNEWRIFMVSSPLFAREFP